MTIPLALLIGDALENAILPALGSQRIDASSKGLKPALEKILSGKVTRYFILFIFAYSAMSAYSTSLKIRDEFSLQQSDLETFSWVRKNTPADAEFLLVTGQLPLRDAWSEWFPVLSERHSQATVFGFEWVNDGQFGDRVEMYKNLQSCVYEDVFCLDNWHMGLVGDYSYVYLWNQNGAIRYPLTIHLMGDPEYDLVYRNDQTMIFQKQR
jgi:hypothetical protein